ncbi:MAG: hypothetical protein HY706_01265 [Candidatus Hydrogenedentes bacterium]|nr:hypothetical protein [Candidatus Hydrogenedentota bacterium]
MKHIVSITKKPSQADIVQEIVCQMNHFLVVLLGNKGGTSPIKSVVEEKCDLPIS